MTKRQAQDRSQLIFIRLTLIPEIYGISNSTIYRWIKSGKLPEPTHVSDRVQGYPREILDAIFLKKIGE